MLLPRLRRRDPAAESSAASRSSIAGPQVVQLDRVNVVPSLRVPLQEARGPSIPRALPQADSRRADRQAPAHGLVLVRVPALAHAPVLARVPEQAALERRRR